MYIDVRHINTDKCLHMVLVLFQMVNVCSLTSIHADGPVVSDEFLIYVDYVN